MSEYLEVLKACVEQAPHDDDAATLLRSIVQGATEHAPVEALVELGELLIDMRDRDLHRAIERN